MTGTSRPSAARLPAAPLAVAALLAVAAAAPAAGVEDDYARALAQARARKVPIFVDAWAPW